MHGHLVIADISGYTQFLTSSELEHANSIVGELLNAVIASIQAPLTVSSIEGDAVFMYGAMPEDMAGQTVLESVELLYCAFAGALETMVLNTTCRCNACANIASLGLKIVMHCGEFAKTEIAGRETLSGPDVIVAHRLLKNGIREALGIDDYLFLTQQCVDDLGVEAIVAGWSEHTEEYEHVGTITGYVSSLPDVWAFVQQQNEHKVVQRDAWLSVTVHSQAPPAIVWDQLVDPIKRTRWLGANNNAVSGDIGGRIGPGAEYHCAHGEDNDVIVFSVLDLRPVDYITLTIPFGADAVMVYTDYVVPSGSGTRIVSYTAPLMSVSTGEALPDDVLAEMADAVSADYRGSLERLAAMADEAFTTLASV